LSLGPSSSLVHLAVPANGPVVVHPPGREPVVMNFGARLAGRSLAAVLQPGLSVLFALADPAGRLLALSYQVSEGRETMVIHDGPPAVIVDAAGVESPVGDVLTAIGRNTLRALTERRPDRLGIRILINPDHPVLFSVELREQIREPRMLNRLEMWFDGNTGVFDSAVLVVQDRASQRLITERKLAKFPLRWPGMIEAPAKAMPESASAGAPVATPPPPPVPATSEMPVDAALAALAALELKNDERALWREVEANLLRGEALRTYRMVSAYPHLVARKSRAWPRELLLESMGKLPGAALQLLFVDYELDLCLFLADEHPEREMLHEYLREHELDRLLSMNPALWKEDTDSARQLLRVSFMASPKDVRRAWRMLLGWLNADHGRQDERAIHRKKDEIAKRLQRARDLLSAARSHPSKGR